MGLGIKLLDQQGLVRSHVRRVVPLVRSRIGLDLPRLRARLRREVVPRLGLAEFWAEIRVHGNQVALLGRASVAQGEVTARHDIKRAPENDDRPAALFQLLRLVRWEVFQLAVSD